MSRRHKQRQINEWLGRLHGAIGALEDRVSTLRDRVKPILNPSEEADCSKAETAGPELLADLANILRNSVIRIDDLNRSLTDLDTRIEL